MIAHVFFFIYLKPVSFHDIFILKIISKAVEQRLQLQGKEDNPTCGPSKRVNRPNCGTAYERIERTQGEECHTNDISD